MKNWFEVSKEGLAKILERRGKEFAVFELIQNGWDEPGISKVAVTLDYEGRNRAVLIVEDDAPDGFKDLSHAFTLFAESAKKSNPEQRGRFNLGEKLVLAMSEEVTIQTTSGGIRFDCQGRHHLRSRQPVGSRVECRKRLSQEDCERIDRQIRTLITPEYITLTFNGQPLTRKVSIDRFPARLQIEIGDESGLLRRVQRETTVRVHKVLPGEIATLYELGIPVVETGDKWHYDIAQKVPLTLDRENVAPSFLKAVRVAVFNRMHCHLTPEDANTAWAESASASPECSAAAMQSYLSKRFGEKRVSYDPSDPEANKLAVSQGYTVVHGGMMSAGAWGNAKVAQAILPAGQVTPSPKQYSEDGHPLTLVSEITDGMRRVEAYAEHTAEKVLRARIRVLFASEVTWSYAATYGPGGTLTFNVGRLGKAWFDLEKNRRQINELLIHEFGHHYSLDHRSSGYHDALCKIGAAMVELAMAGGLNLSGEHHKLRHKFSGEHTSSNSD